jgi:hypothetical protein
MDCYARLNRTNDRDVHGYNLNQTNKLPRTYVSLLEALNRHRGKRQPKVTVEHFHCITGAKPSLVTSNTRGAAHKTNGSTPCVNGSGMQSDVGLRRDAAHRAREWVCSMAAAGCTEVLFPALLKTTRTPGKHGRYSAESIALRRALRALLSSAREAICSH